MLFFLGRRGETTYSSAFPHMPFYTFFPLTKRKRSLCSQAAPVCADSFRTPWDANTNPSLRQAGIYPGRTGTPELGRRKRPPSFLIFSPMLPRPTLVFARRPASRAQAVPQQQPCSSESKRHGHFCRAFPNRAQLQPGGIVPVSVRSPSKRAARAGDSSLALCAGLFSGFALRSPAARRHRRAPLLARSRAPRAGLRRASSAGSGGSGRCRQGELPAARRGPGRGGARSLAGSSTDLQSWGIKRD